MHGQVCAPSSLYSFSDFCVHDNDKKNNGRINITLPDEHACGIFIIYLSIYRQKKLMYVYPIVKAEINSVINLGQLFCMGAEALIYTKYVLL